MNPDEVVSVAVREKYPQMAGYAILAVKILGDKLVPQEFSVGNHRNKCGESLITLALLMLAREKKFSKQETLLLFGEAYDEVRADPDGESHPNIRQLMKKGKKSVILNKGFKDSKWMSRSQSKALPSQAGLIL